MNNELTELQERLARDSYNKGYTEGFEKGKLYQKGLLTGIPVLEANDIVAEKYREGGGYYVTSNLELFEVPQYHGEPRLVGKYETLGEAIKEGESWT